MGAIALEWSVRAKIVHGVRNWGKWGRKKVKKRKLKIRGVTERETDLSIDRKGIRMAKHRRDVLEQKSMRVVVQATLKKIW